MPKRQHGEEEQAQPEDQQGQPHSHGRYPALNYPDPLRESLCFRVWTRIASLCTASMETPGSLPCCEKFFEPLLGIAGIAKGAESGFLQVIELPLCVRESHKKVVKAR